MRDTVINGETVTDTLSIMTYENGTGSSDAPEVEPVPVHTAVVGSPFFRSIATAGTVFISHDAECVCYGFSIDDSVSQFDDSLLVPLTVVLCYGSVCALHQCAEHHGEH